MLSNHEDKYEEGVQQIDACVAELSSNQVSWSIVDENYAKIGNCFNLLLEEITEKLLALGKQQEVDAAYIIMDPESVYAKYLLPEAASTVDALAPGMR